MASWGGAVPPLCSPEGANFLIPDPPCLRGNGAPTPLVNKHSWGVGDRAALAQAPQMCFCKTSLVGVSERLIFCFNQGKFLGPEW